MFVPIWLVLRRCEATNLGVLDLCYIALFSPYPNGAVQIRVGLELAEKWPFLEARRSTQTFSGQSFSRALRVMDLRNEERVRVSVCTIPGTLTPGAHN